MSARPRATRAGVTLRHWTADRLSFKGGREGPSASSSGTELADSRLLRLVASRLSRLEAPRIGLTA
jgi:hypothetical protein